MYETDEQDVSTTQSFKKCSSQTRISSHTFASMWSSDRSKEDSFSFNFAIRNRVDMSVTMVNTYQHRDPQFQRKECNTKQSLQWRVHVKIWITSANAYWVSIWEVYLKSTTSDTVHQTMNKRLQFTS